MTPSRVVLLNSGGVDSRVCAQRLRDSGMEVHSLFIDWNVRARPRSPFAALRTAEMFCSSHEVLPYGADWACWNEVQQKTTTQQASLTSTMLGVQYAIFRGIEYVANGTRSDVYPSRSWIDRLQETLSENRLQPVTTLLFPVYDMAVGEVDALVVEPETTWSCSVAPACGGCNGCRRREKLLVQG